ncbi:MAG: hypothetical protein LBF16_04740 [Pseudomonadales bacterium]|nr:hypothetical protein [Pseudomonadales bacterium]
MHRFRINLLIDLRFAAAKDDGQAQGLAIAEDAHFDQRAWRQLADEADGARGLLFVGFVGDIKLPKKPATP